MPSPQTAIGHWPEVLFPAFSMLRAEAGRSPARVLLLSLKRAHLMPWARTILALALGRRRHQDLPPMLWQRETDSVWHQICECSTGGMGGRAGEGRRIGQTGGHPEGRGVREHPRVGRAAIWRRFCRARRGKRERARQAPPFISPRLRTPRPSVQSGGPGRQRVGLLRASAAGHRDGLGGGLAHVFQPERRPRLSAAGLSAGTGWRVPVAALV